MNPPDLVTVLVEPQRDGSLSASFIADGPVPKDSRGHLDMDALVEAVDLALLAHYGDALRDRVVAIQIGWYPWGDKNPPKGPGYPKAWLMFEIRQAEGGGYEAVAEEDPPIAVRVDRLRELPDAVTARVLERWPALQGHPGPAMLSWERDLAGGQFRDAATPTDR